MERIQKTSNAIVLLSAFSHFFCCVLPTISSIVGLGASFGMVSTNLTFFKWFHEHEEQILVFSAIALTVSAIAQIISWRIDCHNSGCEHGKCTPKKKVSNKIFTIAVVLFLINLTIHLMQHTH